MALPPVRPETSLEIKRTFPVPREKVFAAWTAPEALRQWFGPEGLACPLAEVDLRSGGRYRITMENDEGAKHTVVGEYREVSPPEKLVFTWTWEEGGSEVGETLVTLEFRDREGSTEVVLTHERFPSEETRDHHKMGWSSTLDCLEAYLA